MTTIYHRSMTDEDRERYDAIQQVVTYQWSSLCMLDRQLKALNPSHTRRFMSKQERRSLHREREMAYDNS